MSHYTKLDNERAKSAYLDLSSALRNWQIGLEANLNSQKHIQVLVIVQLLKRAKIQLLQGHYKRSELLVYRARDLALQVI